MPEPSAATLMFISYRHAEEEVLAAVREAGHSSLTLAQARLCARIGEEGTRLTDLARQAQVTKQTAGALIDQLAARGYVERVPDPRDGRARLIRLAAHGRDAQAVARRAERRIERAWAAHLGVDRFRALRDAIEDLREITDPYR